VQFEYYVVAFNLLPEFKSCVANIVVVIDVHDWQLPTESSITFGSSLQVSHGNNTVSSAVCDVPHRADGWSEYSNKRSFLSWSSIVGMSGQLLLSVASDLSMTTKTLQRIVCFSYAIVVFVSWCA